MPTKSTVTVRMYHVGFGDAFLVTVRQGEQQWRMLVDCGVHSSGTMRPLDSVVDSIIADLTDDNGNASVDLVVATHRHADHIAGFARPAWDTVQVGSVWLPWVEDPADPEAQDLQRESDAVAAALVGFAEQAFTVARQDRLAISKRTWNTIGALAANATINQEAMRRLRGETDGFAAQESVRYLSNDAPDDPFVDSPLPDVKVHVVGPSRSHDVLKKMNPPKSAEWFSQLTLMAAAGPDTSASQQLFDQRFRFPHELLASEECAGLRAHEAMTRRLHQMGEDEALQAASKLEEWCNNTSLFVILEVGTRRLVFPGDTQEGGWRHVLNRTDTLALVQGADFYKVSHHGSHNGTPQRFIDDILGDDRSLMLPFGPVKQWKKIPVRGLIDAFAVHQHRVASAVADYRTDPTAELGPDELWSEVSL